MAATSRASTCATARMTEQNGSTSGGTAPQQLLPRHRYMLQKVDAAFGIYDELSTESMFLQSGVIDKVRKLNVCRSIVQTAAVERVFSTTLDWGIDCCIVWSASNDASLSSSSPASPLNTRPQQWVRLLVFRVS